MDCIVGRSEYSQFSQKGWYATDQWDEQRSRAALKLSAIKASSHHREATRDKEYYGSVPKILANSRKILRHPATRLPTAPDIKAAIDASELVCAYVFECACAQCDINHRLTKPKHLGTNGQVERMNRAIKDATVKRYFYEKEEGYVANAPIDQIDQRIRAKVWAPRYVPLAANRK